LTEIGGSWVQSTGPPGNLGHWVATPAKFLMKWATRRLEVEKQSWMESRFFDVDNSTTLALVQFFY